MVIGRARAAVFDGPERGFEIRSLPVGEPRAGELVVAVDCCTLCGSDLHTVLGRRPTPTPTILGHEAVGRILALGREAPRKLAGETLAVGDRVVWSITASCGGCFFCQHDLPQKCEQLRKFGHEPLGEPPVPYGGLAEVCVLPPGTTVVRVAERVPDRAAAPAACATATVAAALRTGGGAAQRSVLVLGGGLLGLTACAMARADGARAIVLIEPDARRRALAMRFGADDALDAARPLSPERGFDLALEMSGATTAMQTAVAALRIGGTAVLVGAVFPGPPLPLDAETLVRRCLTLRGLHNYAPGDLATAVAFLERCGDRYRFEELVPDAFDLDEVGAAFAHAESARPPRVAIMPGRAPGGPSRAGPSTPAR